jgi:hypothetical protein
MHEKIWNFAITNYEYRSIELCYYKNSEKMHWLLFRCLKLGVKAKSLAPEFVEYVNSRFITEKMHEKIWNFAITNYEYRSIELCYYKNSEKMHWLLFRCLKLGVKAKSLAPEFVEYVNSRFITEKMHEKIWKFVHIKYKTCSTRICYQN